MINIEKRTLRAFEQNALTSATFFIEQFPHDIHIRQHAIGNVGQFVMSSTAAVMFAGLDKN